MRETALQLMRRFRTEFTNWKTAQSHQRITTNATRFDSLISGLMRAYRRKLVKISGGLEARGS